MAQPHDDAPAVSFVRLRADLQLLRQPFFGDDQRVVASGGHGTWDILKNRLAVMLNLADLAMHDLSRPDDIAAKRRPDCLVPEADAKKRDLPRKMFDQIDADPSFLRRAGAGRDQDMIGLPLFNFFRSDLIVAAHLNLLPQFPDVLYEVVGEGIVIVEDKDHLEPLILYARHPERRPRSGDLEGPCVCYVSA